RQAEAVTAPPYAGPSDGAGDNQVIRPTPAPGDVSNLMPAGAMQAEGGGRLIAATHHDLGLHITHSVEADQDDQPERRLSRVSAPNGGPSPALPATRDAVPCHQTRWWS